MCERQSSEPVLARLAAKQQRHAIPVDLHGTPAVITALFAHVASNRERVVLELRTLGFYGDHPHMRRSLRHELHFCLEAFEARVMRAFAGALWRE